VSLHALLLGYCYLFFNQVTISITTSADLAANIAQVLKLAAHAQSVQPYVSVLGGGAVAPRGRMFLGG
jgi:ribosomal protein S9